MDLYFERHDGEAATVEQFVQCFADVNKRDPKQFMRWYSQAGTPEVVASGHYDASAKTYKLDLAQIDPADAGPGRPKSRWSFRSSPAWSAGTAATCRSRSPTGRNSSAACWCWTRPRRASSSPA